MALLACYCWKWVAVPANWLRSVKITTGKAAGTAVVRVRIRIRRRTQEVVYLQQNQPEKRTQRTQGTRATKETWQPKHQSQPCYHETEGIPTAAPPFVRRT
ncbi:MAG: hypothetical protein ABI759_13690 [Candidatus Solibacter sp.]